MVKKLHKACINYASWKVQQMTPWMEIIKTLSIKILIILIIILTFYPQETTIIIMKEDYILQRLHNPSHKPWLYPEQISAKKIHITDCVQ